jgi:hypothetical protein
VRHQPSPPRHVERAIMTVSARPAARSPLRGHGSQAGAGSQEGCGGWVCYVRLACPVWVADAISAGAADHRSTRPGSGQLSNTMAGYPGMRRWLSNDGRFDCGFCC